MKDYRVIRAFAQGNTHYASGVELSLSDKQATFLLTGGFIEAVDTTPPVMDAPESELPAEASGRGKKGGKA